MAGKGGQVQKEGFEVKGSEWCDPGSEAQGRAMWEMELLGTGYRLLEALFLC